MYFCKLLCNHFFFVSQENGILLAHLSHVLDFLSGKGMDKLKTESHTTNFQRL